MRLSNLKIKDMSFLLKRLVVLLNNKNISISQDLLKGFGSKYKFYTTINYKYSYKMKIIYFRQQNDQLSIRFHYKNSELNIDRDFNFERNVNELIEVFLGRMKNNLAKDITKKFKKKKTKNTQENLNQQPIPEITLQFFKRNQPIQNTTFLDILDCPDEITLQIIDDLFQVRLNQPWISSLVLPKSILANYFVYPSKIEMQFAEKKYSKGTWYRGKMPKSNDIQQIEWEEISQSLCYQTKAEDIGYMVKFELIPGNEKNVGPSISVIGKNEVQAGPGKCPFENRHLFTQNKLNGTKFRIVTYNILADLYADSDYSRKELFPYCPPYALEIDYRKQLFIKELRGYNADIICLQEVDCKIFDFDLESIFEEDNLTGILQKKGQTAEGVAIFYNNQRFELISSNGITIGEQIENFEPFKILTNKIQHNKPLMERVLPRSTAVQVVVVKFKETNNYLIIANTHLYFHPDADHIRLLQIAYSIIYVQHIYKNVLKEHHLNENQCSILFCGDFNSTPECGIYKLLTQQYVDENFIDWKSNENETIQNVSLSQPFKFESACGCPKYTNYTQIFSGCLDYIFYQTDNLKIDQIIPLPSEEELKAHIAIPNVVYPSDHIALVADLKWKIIPER